MCLKEINLWWDLDVSIESIRWKKNLGEIQILLWLRCLYITDDKNTHNHIRQDDNEFFEVITPFSYTRNANSWQRLWRNFSYHIIPWLNIKIFYKSSQIWYCQSTHLAWVWSCVAIPIKAALKERGEKKNHRKKTWIVHLYKAQEYWISTLPCQTNFSHQQKTQQATALTAKLTFKLCSQTLHWESAVSGCSSQCNKKLPCHPQFFSSYLILSVIQAIITLTF